MYSIPVGYNNKVMSPSLKFYDFESLKLDKKNYLLCKVNSFTYSHINYLLPIHSKRI